MHFCYQTLKLLFFQDRVTGLNRGLAFLDFEDETSALNLLKASEQENAKHVIDERTVYISGSNEWNATRGIATQSEVGSAYASEESNETFSAAPEATEVSGDEKDHNADAK